MLSGQRRVQSARPFIVSARVKESVVLLVENEENDVFFFRRALSAIAFRGRLQVVESVTQARAYLLGDGRYSDRLYFPVPDLIISDFKLHGETGLEFCRWIQSQPEYAEIPFVLLTGSATQKEGEAAVTTGAAAFFNKTADFAEMKRILKGILEHLPPPGPSKPLDAGPSSVEKS